MKSNGYAMASMSATKRECAQQFSTSTAHLNVYTHAPYDASRYPSWHPCSHLGFQNWCRDFIETSCCEVAVLRSHSLAHTPRPQFVAVLKKPHSPNVQRCASIDRTRSRTPAESRSSYVDVRSSTLAHTSTYAISKPKRVDLGLTWQVLAASH